MQIIIFLKFSRLIFNVKTRFSYGSGSAMFPMNTNLIAYLFKSYRTVPTRGHDKKLLAFRFSPVAMKPANSAQQQFQSHHELDLAAVLWIRIQVFRSLLDPDPYSEYGSRSIHATRG